MQVGITTISAACHSSHVCDLLDNLFTIFGVLNPQHSTLKAQPAIPNI